MKELKIFLKNYKGNSHQARLNIVNSLQDLFGGDWVRKPNFFGYFLRVRICPETTKIFVHTNRFDSKKEFLENLKLAELKTLRNT